MYSISSQKFQELKDITVKVNMDWRIEKILFSSFFAIQYFYFGTANVSCYFVRKGNDQPLYPGYNIPPSDHQAILSLPSSTNLTEYK